MSALANSLPYSSTFGGTPYIIMKKHDAAGLDLPERLQSSLPVASESVRLFKRSPIPGGILCSLGKGEAQREARREREERAGTAGTSGVDRDQDQAQIQADDLRQFNLNLFRQHRAARRKIKEACTRQIAELALVPDMTEDLRNAGYDSNDKRVGHLWSTRKKRLKARVQELIQKVEDEEVLKLEVRYTNEPAERYRQTYMAAIGRLESLLTQDTSIVDLYQHFKEQRHEARQALEALDQLSYLKSDLHLRSEQEDSKEAMDRQVFLRENGMEAPNDDEGA